MGWKGKNLQLILHPLQGHQHLFFQVIIPLTTFTAIILGVWNMFGSKFYGSRAAVTQNDI